MQMNTESKVSQINTALYMLLNQSPQNSSHGASNSSKQPFQVRNIKLEFPHFDGNNVLDWIFRGEKFFYYYSKPDPNRLTIALVPNGAAVLPFSHLA
jgi:hypothetical protein